MNNYFDMIKDILIRMTDYDYFLVMEHVTGEKGIKDKKAIEYLRQFSDEFLLEVLEGIDSVDNRNSFKLHALIGRTLSTPLPPQLWSA